MNYSHLGCHFSQLEALDVFNRCSLHLSKIVGIVFLAVLIFNIYVIYILESFLRYVACFHHVFSTPVKESQVSQEGFEIPSYLNIVFMRLH